MPEVTLGAQASACSNDRQSRLKPALPGRVLIVRLGAFGDILHTLPLAADLRAAGCTVDWVCEDRWAVLLEGNPAVSTVHRLPRKARGWSLLPELTRLRAAMQARPYHAVIDAQGLAKSSLIALLAGAGRRVGFARPRAREGAWLVPTATVAASAIHVIDQQRQLASALGIEAAGDWSFPLPAWAEQAAWASTWMTEHGLVGCHALNVGAGWPTKVWPAERLGGFLHACRDAQRPCLVLWGSPVEETLARSSIAAAGHGTLAPPTDLPQLAGLLRQVGVLVSGDTGPLHLARAVGTPAVGLFGPVPHQRNGPRGAHWMNLQAPGAAWERKDVSKVDMGAISVADVVQAIATISRLPPRSATAANVPAARPGDPGTGG